MSDTNSLMRELNALVESRVFSAEAAEGIAKLRKEVIAAQGSLEHVKELSKTYREERDRARNEVARWETKQQAIEAREAAVAKREAEVTKLEMAKAVSEAEGKAYKDILHRVFENRKVRENVAESGYAPTGSTSNNKNIIREEA